MATTSFQNVEGFSTIRPPFFNGNDFNYWKARMRIYLQSVDYDLWDIVENGPYMPIKIVEKESMPKPRNEWDEHDKRLMSMNAKAINAFYCALDKNEFNRISTCTSAHEIWKMLEVTHEGTNQVKETKINILVHNYELFRMLEGETIVEMYTRFTDITNAMISLGKSITNAEMVSKILRSLPKSWKTKVTAIQEAKDLKTLPLEQLIGSLMTYELSLKEDQTKEEEDKKRRSIALKSSINDDEEDEDSDLEDFALLTKKFKKFLKFKKYNNRRNVRKDDLKEEKGKKETIICHECNKPGHMKIDCPKRWRNKKKAFKATWDDSDESDSEEETQEVANMCFMAINDEVSSLDLDESLSYDELLDGFNELHDKFEKVGLKNISLKKKIALLSKELDDLRNEKDKAKPVIDSECKLCENLKNENNLLNDKVLDLSKIVYKFTNGKENFELMLGKQKCIFDKGGLGYKPFIKQKYLKNYFVKALNQNESKYTCNYCNGNGHTSFSCQIKKNAYFGIKSKWVPKSLKTNIQGPKAIWVPKFK